MLEIKSLSKTYGKIRGAEDISFTLERGEVVGFIGPNGAGKSTTMNMISGCLAPTSGDAEADGRVMSKNAVEFKSLIGYLPEKPPLYTEFTVREYLELVYKMKKTKLDMKPHIAGIIESFGLSQVSDRVIGNLSKGYRQRIGLAQAFVGNPSYVILDEPTVGLDPVQKKQTLELIKRMSKNHGILLSSHILSEISFVCDRVIIINGGKIIKQISNADGKKNVYAYKIVGNEEKIINTLLSHDAVSGVEKKDGAYLVEADETALESIFYKLAEAKLPVVALELYRIDVEDEFIKATSKNERRHKE